MKGKHGASATTRHDIEARDAEIAKLKHALKRAEVERDELAEKLRTQQISSAAERRALARDRDDAVSPRMRELEALVVEWRARFEEEGKRSTQALRQSDDAVVWIARHMRSEHGWSETGTELLGRIERDLTSLAGLSAAAREAAEVPVIERIHPKFNGRWLEMDVR